MALALLTAIVLYLMLYAHRSDEILDSVKTTEKLATDTKECGVLVKDHFITTKPSEQIIN